ncbi:hypothetical protein V2J09_019294 [Rumex salicifolius]
MDDDYTVYLVKQKRYAKVWIFECSEPSHEAYKLALAAMILLALTHVVTLTLGGSICISSREDFVSSHRNKKIAASTLILSWILVVVAFSLLVMGVVSNARPQNACGLLQLHVLSIGGILCFIHGFFVIVYYLSATANAEVEDMMMNHQRATA